MPSHTIVGVLRGGPSSEYDVSLKSGATVLKNMPEHYAPADIFIDKKGIWHSTGLERTPEQALKGVDVVFNALHGEYGEDGKVQRVLDEFSVPYTGSRALASAMAMNKVLTKKVYNSHNIKTPYAVIVRKESYTPSVPQDIFSSFPMPAVIKPATGGSSLGITVAYTLPDIEEALQYAFLYSDMVIIEEFIPGKEAACGVINGFRDQEVYALMPTEIVDTTNGDIWGYRSKYDTALHELRTPGDFSHSEKEEFQEIAKEAHDLLDLRHYSRTDFIVHPKRGIYALETNTLPGLTESSLLPHALIASGSDVPEFLDHVLGQALHER